MWWMAFYGTATQMMEASGKRELASINDRLQNAQVRTNRTKAAGSNIASAAGGNLARWAQSVNNQRVLEAGGKELEVNAINYGRQTDARVTGSFSASIGAAEAAGRSAVAAGFAGISGDVVDSVNLSTRLRDTMVKEQTRANFKAAEWDYRQRQAAVATQTVRRMDSSILLDNLDFTQGYDQKTWSQSLFQAGVAGGLKYGAEALKNWPDSQPAPNDDFNNPYNYRGTDLPDSLRGSNNYG